MLDQNTAGPKTDADLSANAGFGPFGPCGTARAAAFARSAISPRVDVSFVSGVPIVGLWDVAGRADMLRE